MKKGLLLLSLLVLMNCMAVQAAEEPQISVFLNAQRVEFPDQQPALVSDRTLVPLRAIFEAYGCMVEWSDNAAYAACAMPGSISRHARNAAIRFMGQRSFPAKRALGA